MTISDRDGVPLEPDRQKYWDDRYAAEGDVWGVEPNRFVAAELGGLPAGRVLDLGAGQGRNAVWLAQQGHRVTAVDLSAVAIERTQQLAVAAGVELEAFVADLDDWEPAEEAYDLVLMSYLQFAEPLRTRVHAMARAAAVPGGLVFVIAHHLDNLDHGVGGPQVAELLFTEDMLAADFAGWDVERLEAVRRPVEDADRPAIDVLLKARKPAS